ncbi:MAG: alginate export family protein [Planctomycetota bacterium]
MTTSSKSPLALLLAALASACASPGPPRPSTAPARADGGQAAPAQPAEATEVPAPADGPWRIEERAGFPEWLELGVEQRTRYEYLDEDFRASNAGEENELFALRTLVDVTLHEGPLRATAELMDSRQYGAPDDAPVNTTIVNPVELLQAHVGYRAEGVFTADDALDMQLGRQTLNLGSRRLVARNRFRNTINSFTGLQAAWSGAAEETVRAFAFFPVRRLPRDQDELLDNEIEFDEEREETLFYGIHAAKSFPERDLDAEVYIYGLDEDDEDDVATRDRRIWTAGARLLRAPAEREFGFEWESMYQFGDSRASTSAADQTDLDHSAHFHHLSVGYRFPGESKPTLECLFDYASGDDDPDDDENNRFDTLFGARRFEFGPTGIFGAFARSNLVSPGLRLKLSPAASTQVMLAHRLHYLASDTDAWTTSGLVDPSGDAGSFLGQLAEIRVRHDLVSKNLRLEGGVAHLFAGDFIDDAPNATVQGDSTYAYLGATLWL